MWQVFLIITALLPGLFTERAVGSPGEKIIYIGEGGVILKGSDYLILPQGKLVKVGKSFETTISKGGNYLGIMTIEEDSLKFTLISRDGELMWSRNFSLEEEGGPDFYVSDIGVTISVDVPSLTLYLFDIRGKLIRKVKPIKDAGYDEERAFVIDIGKDGLHFAVFAQKTAREPAYLLIFDFEGVKVYERRFDGYIPFKVFISPHESFVVASMYKVEKMVVGESKTAILKRDGTLEKEIPFLAEGAVFTRDEGVVALFGKRWLKVIDLSSMEEVFKKVTLRKILNVGFSIDGSLLLWTFTGHYEKNRYVYDHLYFSLYDQEGGKIESGSIRGGEEIPLIHPGYRNFKVAIDGKLLEITF